jgi:hypothetical protein
MEKGKLTASEHQLAHAVAQVAIMNPPIERESKKGRFMYTSSGPQSANRITDDQRHSLLCYTIEKVLKMHERSTDHKLDNQKS